MIFIQFLKYFCPSESFEMQIFESNQLQKNLNPPPLFGTYIAIKSLLQGLLTLLDPIVSSKVNLYSHEMSLSWYFVIVLWIDPIPK